MKVTLNNIGKKYESSTAIPIVILFLVLQKQLVAGLSNGATKG